MRKRFEALKGVQMEFALDSLKNSEEMAANLVAGQLAQGIKSDGSLVSFSYSPFTIAVKRTKSGLARVTDHLTNYDTGESYRNLFMKVRTNDIEFGTSTTKENAIMDRMDGEAFRPTRDSKITMINEKIHPEFVEKVKEFLKV